jgi:hypothetical protein
MRVAISLDWEIISNKHTNRQTPIFRFKDGPVTRAAKTGVILFLEDFDLPSQVFLVNAPL